MLKLTILLSVLFLSLVKPSAHEIELPPSPYIKASKQYHELFEHLDHILEESRLYGATVSDAEQIKFVEKLIAIIPPPRIHGVRFHGVLAPSASDRKNVVPAKLEAPIQGELFECKNKNKTKRTSWADLLKRTFQIDLSACFLCGGKMKFTGAVLKRSDVLETLTAAGLSPTPE